VSRLDVVHRAAPSHRHSPARRRTSLDRLAVPASGNSSSRTAVPANGPAIST